MLKLEFHLFYYNSKLLLMKITNKQNIAWVDLLRVVACFLVVLAHTCDPFVAQFGNNDIDFTSGVLWGSLVRPCVPLFVMISGILLLPIKTDMHTFYNRRLKRVVIPLIIWSVLTPILYYVYINYGGGSSSPNIDITQYTIPATVTKMYTFIFNFNYTIIPLWYLYMLVGLYLFMPIINAWLVQAEKKDIKTVLYIWGVSMILPYIQMAAPALGYEGNYGNMGLLGICDWNPYGTFYYFSGFLGYIILAYYLTKYPLEWSWKRTLITSAIMYSVGYAITSIGFFMTQQLFPGNYAYLEIVWYFSGINVFMMTFALFIIMQKIKVKGSATLSKMAALTFGVYLCHFLVVQIFYDLLYDIIPVPAGVKIPIMAIVSFVVTLTVVYFLSKSRITRRMIM